MRSLARVFQALSDETRLLMLGLLLREGELCVCDFIEVMGITQSKASRHLRRLVDAGLLDDRRQGTWVYFRLAGQPAPAQARLIELLPELVAERMPRELFTRLAAWRRSKERDRQSCAAPRRRVAPITGGNR